ncbi:NAD-glutamate dehydrogenase [Methylocystis sp. MJC1]|jgi:glutamate dehydrogenase|uniref:NAD-glutamate dehydrogenase domain-containing protein n=1 Tax=Methylocystis sp. MJC1 TaxID=2654282 RepID=UPI0013EDDEDA|nr:NAD-glutamate dehydrogenase domain-containing protein [Methylocystis sp. MJC1]KAF2992816.1 NAD-specific glutamate dehydrogenase [Methylocystis sp. MJC1]MBU6526776.1 NAD-glutamate dehydrogenase [Methylocystis sp. MJC1]UZX13210.1 NAD-glutamate dehydrogenase [Methylocystis sp. MJC1]
MEGDIRLRNPVQKPPQRSPRGKPLNVAAAEFSPDYRDLVAPRQRLRDLLKLGEVFEPSGHAIDLRRLADGREYDLRIYSAQTRALDDLIPVLHNLGLPAVDQILFAATVSGEKRFIRSFRVRPADPERVQQSRAQLLAALAALLSGEAEDDPLNKLVLLAGLSAREIGVLRAYCCYYLQLGVRVDRSRLYDALLGDVEVTRLLFAYFETRFHPDHAGRGSFDAMVDVRQRLIAAFDKVTNLTDDRVFRDLFNLIDATLRTNFYLHDEPKPKVLALKINSLGVIGAPAPKPMFEIFVHARSMQGIHLRGAKVARGGIRWSDRAHDLRTEILDLMQTQMTKNALIVPQGAKGGFVLKVSSADPTRREEAGKSAYRAFIGALLDLTDNLDPAKSGPAERISYDEPDPYLVVAADKGTGGWSDIANEIARSRSFWLDDAFATGGSNGYSHKRLGITSRGAWVCVRRHFREIGRNIDDQAFTVVGVGSMDGDVFGNGMLETRTIRLLGAFSGEHIFIDPNPDPLISYAERRRLFDKPRSSWADYDPSKISRGGGVYRRDAKDIELSPEARSWLQARNRLVDGEGLIRLLLAAPVDLLWMGGVGSYVKAGPETDESVGDRVNDGARIDANQLRAKVVGEGANLGFTQRGRIEYALNGGRINTDAVDNSAGVDLSDHEVNLKILLRGTRQAPLAASDEIHRLLESLTDEVCAAVLDDNYHQSLCISLERERSLSDIASYLDVADRLEASGQLDRQSDAFPNRRELLARTEGGLTRPELSILMADAKLALKRALLEAPRFFEVEWISDFLVTYFPESLRSSYAPRIASHPLAREIAATVICNKIVNQAGARFLLFGDPLAPTLLTDAVGLYLAFDQILGGERWRSAVRSLDGRMNSGRQYEYLLQLEDALAYLCRWALQGGRRLQPVESEVAEWRAYLEKYLAYFSQSAEVSILDANAPEASREMFLNRLRDFPFLVDLAQQAGKDIAVAARLFDEVGGSLGMRQIAALAAELTARDAWEGKLQSAVDERLRSATARIAAIALRVGVDEPAAVFRLAGLAPKLTELRKLRGEIIESAPKTVVPFALFASELDALVEACDSPRRAA